MVDWQPHREPLRVTLTRTLGIALVLGAVLAPWAGGFTRWPVISLLILWPALGGHWIDLVFLNWLRPHLPRTRSLQRSARIAIWFIGGMLLALGMRLTAGAMAGAPALAWLSWAAAGALFVAIELIAHGALYLRRRPSFYDGVG